MDAIYIVRYSDEVAGRPYSTREKALEYAKLLMDHFGGLWEELVSGCIFQKVYQSKSSFRRPNQTSPLRIFIEKSFLNDYTLPIIEVVGTSEDRNNQAVHTLGIPKDYKTTRL